MMKMSKKFDEFMAKEYTIVFAVALSIISAVATHFLGMREFNIKYFLFELVIALAAAWLAVTVLPIFPIGNYLAMRIFKKEPPSRGYMFFMSLGICSLIIPVVCMIMCSMIVGYENNLSWSSVWNGFLTFAAPMYVLCIILVQLLGKPLFKIAIHFLGDEAFEKEETEAVAVDVLPEEDDEEEKDLSVEAGGAMHGDWTVVNKSPVGRNTLIYHIEQRGEKLYGSIDYEGKNAKIRNGSFADGKFSFDTTLIMPFGSRSVHMEGQIEADHLKGISIMDERETPLDGKRNGA